MTTKQTKLNDETVAAMTKSAKSRKPVETPIQKFQESSVSTTVEANAIVVLIDACVGVNDTTQKILEFAKGKNTHITIALTGMLSAHPTPDYILDQLISLELCPQIFGGEVAIVLVRGRINEFDRNDVGEVLLACQRDTTPVGKIVLMGDDRLACAAMAEAMRTRVADIELEVSSVPVEAEDVSSARAHISHELLLAGDAPDQPDTVEEWKKKLTGQISYLIAHLKPEDAVSAIVSRSIEVYYPWYSRILSRQAIAELVLSPLPEPDPDDEIVRSWGMPAVEKPVEGGDWRDRHDDAVAKRREKAEADQTGIIATELLVREFPQLRLAEQYRDTEKVFGEFGFLKVKAQTQASFLQELGPQGDPSLASNQAIVLLGKLQQTAREAGEHHFKPLLLAKVNAKKLWPILSAASAMPQILEQEKAAGLLVSINEGKGIQYGESRIKYGILYQDYFKYQTADGERRVSDHAFVFYDENEQVLKITGFYGNDDIPVLFEGEMVRHFLYHEAHRLLVKAMAPYVQTPASSSETQEEPEVIATNSIGDAVLHKFTDKEIPDWVFQFLEPMFGDDVTGGVKLVDLSFDPAAFSSPLKAARSFVMDPDDVLEEMDASDTYAYVGFDVAHHSVFVILKAAGDVAVVTLRKRAYATFVNKSGDPVKTEISEFSLRVMAIAARIDHSK